MTKTIAYITKDGGQDVRTYNHDIKSQHQALLSLLLEIANGSLEHGSQITIQTIKP